ncbi:MAG TPA: LytTR family DNA-binding domain-containing protein [Pyrinomonadaceae bacterium]|nr:LytTR family DNA-binding domain-containing protein [Pyrinomonadaceae bacterium]
MADSPAIRVLLVDDEPLARDMLREMLQGDPDAQIVGESCNGREALEAIRKQNPDLIFLDVQMPEMGGFDVLSSLSSGKIPYVIFVTAYDQYAVRAFEVQALDYLLKPFDQERFDVSWQRAKSQLLRDQNGGMDQRILALLQEMKAGKTFLERLVIKAAGRIYFLDTKDIDWIEAEGNYVSVHSARKSHLMRETISSLEAQLDPKKFVRIHRSSIVRLDFIQELQPWFHGEYRVILQDGTQLTLSRNHREKLQEALGKLP